MFGGLPPELARAAKNASLRLEQPGPPPEHPASLPTPASGIVVKIMATRMATKMSMNRAGSLGNSDGDFD